MDSTDAWDASIAPALTAAAAAEAQSQAPAGGMAVTSDEQRALCERSIMVYGIPWEMEAEEVKGWLTEKLALLGQQPACVKVRTFDGDAKLQAMYPPFSKHTGYAHVAFQDSVTAAQVAEMFDDEALLDRPIKAAVCTSKTMKLLPPDWADLVGYAEGGEAWVAEQARLRAEQKRRHEHQIRHNRNRRRRKKEQHAEGVRELVGRLRHPVTEQPLADFRHSPICPSQPQGPPPSTVDWASVWAEMPAACDPARGGRLCKASMATPDSGGAPPAKVSARAERKRVQVASFAVVLRQLLGGWGHEPGARAATIVDFGCGSGNLLLPLGSLFPKCSFEGIDMKKVSVELLNERAQTGGLGNVKGVVGAIEDYAGNFDVALGLHACGAATDYAMEKAMRSGAAYVMCPCCVGKLKVSSVTKGPIVIHNAGAEDADGSCRGPRSEWLSGSLAAGEFELLATAADYSHTDGHGYHEEAEQAKTCIELDRNRCAVEKGYLTVLTKLLGAKGEEFVNKSDVLVGAPRAAVAGEVFGWPWPQQEEHGLAAAAAAAAAGT